MRVARKALVWGVGFVLVLIGVLLALPHFFNLNAYRSAIETQLGEVLGRRVAIGKVDLSLLGGVHLILENVTLSPARGENPQKSFRVRELEVHFKFLPLLFKKIRLASVTLEAPELRLEEGRTALAGRRSPPGKQEGPAATAPLVRVSASGPASGESRSAGDLSSGKPAPPWSAWKNFSLGHLSVNRGSVLYFQGGAKPLFTLTDLDLSVNNLSLKGSLRYRLKTTLTYRGTRTYDLSGSIFPDFSRPHAPEVDVSLNAASVDVDSLIALANLLRRLPEVSPGEKGAPGPSPAPPPKPSPAIPWSSVIFTGRIQVKKVLFKKFLMTDLEARLRKERNLIRVNSLSLRAAGGLIQAEGTLGTGRRGGQLSLQGTLQQVESQALITGLTGRPSPLSGPLNLKANLASARNGVRDLSGTVSVQMGPGDFRGKELEEKLRNYSQLVYTDARTGSLTHYDKISGDLRLAGNRVSTENLTGLWPGFRVLLHGSMDFQGLADLKAAVYFPNQGILYLKVRGPITGPSVSPDLGETGREISRDTGQLKNSIEGVFKKLFRSLTP